MSRAVEPEAMGLLVIEESLEVFVIGDDYAERTFDADERMEIEGIVHHGNRSAKTP